MAVDTQPTEVGTQPKWVGDDKHQRPHHAAACRSARFWELLVGVLKHAVACRSGLNFSYGGFFFDNMLNLWTLCCKEVSKLDGSSVVEVLDSTLKCPWLNSESYQIFACQFFSAVPQIFVFFLVLFCHLFHVNS